MKITSALFTCILSCASIFATVEKSIVPFMDQLIIKDLRNKISKEQMANVESFLADADASLRILSFNMLFNLYDSNLEPIDRWQNRKSRVSEYIDWSHPDVIGSQELQADQLNDLLSAIGNEYDFYGVGAFDGKKMGDIPAIFYRKDRLQLIKARTFYFSETPACNSHHPYGGKNTFTFCHFRDKKTDKEFIVINTHLAFSNIEKRYYEACKLRDFLLHIEDLPVIVTGDFNTFSFRQELDLPFYDGDKIVRIIEDGFVCDSMNRALFGHFGPISTTNFCSEKKQPFCSEGEPGIILDHVFVSDGIQVVSHGIDAAKIDGHFPSDHFPVLVDICIAPGKRACTRG